MRRLEAVRLIQWYHFQDHVFPVGANCLLVGDNGSGKTTVLDAVQIALVADAGEALFNRAANEKSRRTLHGYVRWKLGSEDESRPGQVRFGRGGCTSYVLLEFCDDRDASGSFTCGVAFEANETDTDVAKLYFLIPGAAVAQIDAVTTAENGVFNRIVRPLRDFKHWLRQAGGVTGRTRAGIVRNCGIARTLIYDSQRGTMDVNLSSPVLSMGFAYLRIALRRKVGFRARSDSHKLL